MVEEGLAAGAKTAGGLGAKALGVTQAVIFSPAFAVVALAGIIGWELWKGKKDSQEMEEQKVVAN